jgi:hypothetical protein
MQKKKKKKNPNTVRAFTTYKLNKLKETLDPANLPSVEESQQIIDDMVSVQMQIALNHQT